MAPSVTISNLSFRYFETSDPVFSDLTLTIPAGSCCALLGPTGSGKTTLLQVLSGISGSQYKTALASGRVTIAQRVYEPIPDHVLFPDVGLVLQDPAIQISGIKQTVETEIAFTLDNLGVQPMQRAERVTEIMKQLRLTSFATRHPSHVSGGELQRVALGCTLVASPSLLLLDEPANALDTESQSLLTQVLTELRPGTTVLFADSSIDFALASANLFVVLDRGAIVFRGPREEFIRSLPSFERLLPLDPWLELHRMGHLDSLKDGWS